MTEVKNFKDFGIKAIDNGFVGKKIEMYSILNIPITIHDYKIEKSKYTDKGNGLRLTLQIELDSIKRIVWTGSGVLQEMIQQIPRTNFPFITTIKKKENDRLEFT